MGNYGEYDVTLILQGSQSGTIALMTTMTVAIAGFTLVIANQILVLIFSNNVEMDLST